MHELKHFFENNRRWAENVSQSAPDFFTRLSKQQNPEYLWIGCSDSRVPANVIVDMPPGEIFVHRNIANLVYETDPNCLSVIQYAVEVLAVKHIIVCGHYGCGGVQTAMEPQGHGLLDDWLKSLRNLQQKYHAQLASLQTAKERMDMMCELNVIEQAQNICRTPYVRQAWESGRTLAVHSWIYAIDDGKLKDLNACLTNYDDLPSEGGKKPL